MELGDLGTLLTTWTAGRPVGTDDFGNRYYQNKDGSRRWVIYNGTVEASRVPPDWHGWLHHTYRRAADQGAVQGARLRERRTSPISPAPTAPIVPSGSLAAKAAQRPPATGDYQAWKPD